MNCEKCHKETPKGNIYTFYYGKHLDTLVDRWSTLAEVKVTKTYVYHIMGSYSGYICNKCIMKKSIGSFLWFFLIVSFFFAIIITTKIYWSFLPLLCLCVVFGIGYWYMGRKNAGDSILAEIHEERLQGQGANHFFSRSEYAGLKPYTERPYSK
jgi:hypothetical protein